MCNGSYAEHFMTTCNLRILWNQKVHFQVCKNLPAFLTHSMPHILYVNTHFNIIPSHLYLDLPDVLFPSGKQ